MGTVLKRGEGGEYEAGGGVSVEQGRFLSNKVDLQAQFNTGQTSKQPSVNCPRLI